MTSNELLGFVELLGFIEFIGLLGLLGVHWHPLTRIGATGRSEWPHHVCESHFHFQGKLLATAVFVPLMIGLPSINALFYPTPKKAPPFNAGMKWDIEILL